ncbi:DNA-directed RNA polymerase subunit D [Candidatus Woesearchaeota archaeon]|nr:DNA-directed RNA polymerase subunit D [Candidatus Woesearchaeota archaeon]
MEAKLLSKDKEERKISFVLNGTTDWFANTMRRMMIEEVPTLAIEDVEFRDNSSALYDEIIAHRLGLIPIKTDLKGYNLPEECSCKGEGCAKCQLKMVLKTKGQGIVYAEEIKSKDSKCKPVYPKMPIVKLFKGQGLQAEMTAVLGKGKEHTKWSPCLVWYKGWPEFNVTKNADLKACVSKCPVLEISGNTLKIKDMTKWNESYEEICEKNGVQINNSKTNFIFNVESWGQLDVKDIVKEAVSVFQNKLDDLTKQLK